VIAKYQGPRLARRLLIRLAAYQKNHSLLEDFDESFSEVLQVERGLKAQWWFWKNTLITSAAYLRFVLSWRFHMLKNHLIIAYRNFVRHKLFSFINVFGLGIGLGVCLMIGLWVLRESSYDRFHKNAGRIYRVERELFRDNLYSRWPITGGVYKQALIDDIPEVENAVRFWRRGFTIKDHKNFGLRQDLYAVDNSVFDIFDFALEEGEKETALTEPMTAVLTRENAMKYFGTENAVGRSLPIEWDGKTVDFKVTGILKKVPEHSHIHFDMLISFASYPKEQFTNWRANNLYTYVLLGKDASRRDVEEKLKTFAKRRLEPYYGDLLGRGRGIQEVLKMQLFPLTDIHLHPSVNWEAEPGGSIVSVYAFSIVAILILVIACLNFINLSTARAGKRAKEVGLRKTIGAGKHQLRRQFIHESLMLTSIALGLAFVLCELSVRALNRFFFGNLSLSPLFEPRNLAVVVAAAIAVGILAGFYPAFYLTRFEPAGMLKGGPSPGRAKSRFRRNMVVVQFGISIVMIIGMFTVSGQMNYVQTRALGFDKENLILLLVRGPRGAQGYGSFRGELLRDPRIIAVSSAGDAPGDPTYSNGVVMPRDSNEFVNMIYYTTGYDQMETYRMEMAAGRAFSRDFGTDATGAVILNESAATRIGWTSAEAIGKKMVMGGTKAEVSVIGIVKNFNFKSLRSEVEPMVMVLDPAAVSRISVRIKAGDKEGMLRFLRETWGRAFPGDQFEYEFLDARIERMYEGERSARNIFAVFSFLSVLISCLGLLGLASFTAEQKTKEIGIRKALGATTGHIVLLLSKEFIKGIILANVLAWPLAWYLMNRWLENFAFKMGIGWKVFVLTGFLTMSFGIITFIFQTVKAASANPSDSLRYE
jgi:putative ABC transport system permease protein